jgi:hypothetical protein
MQKIEHIPMNVSKEADAAFMRGPQRTDLHRLNSILATNRAVQFPSEMFESALRGCYPRVDNPRWIVTDLLLMPAFEFGYPLAVFIKVKVNNPSRNSDRLCLHRLH